MRMAIRLSFTALTLAPLLFFTSSCASRPPRDVVVPVPCEEFSAQAGEQIKVSRAVTIASGDNVVLRLCANPSTGFAWGEASFSAPSVVIERSREFVPPAIVMPGSAGLEQWTFEAARAGACSIQLSYSRPWNGGEKGVWLFELDVEVR